MVRKTSLSELLRIKSLSIRPGIIQCYRISADLLLVWKDTSMLCIYYDNSLTPDDLNTEICG